MMRNHWVLKIWESSDDSTKNGSLYTTTDADDVGLFQDNMEDIAWEEDQDDEPDNTMVDAVSQ